MGSRLNIGIYIGPNDLDIAAWLNMLQENGLSRATWIRGLICAHSLGRPLMIGCISTNPPEPAKPEPKHANGQLLFGVGDSQAAKKEQYSYGWQVRGPNREFIVGSIANVSISKNSVLPILDEVWANGHAVATFVKSLIRQNLAYASTPIPPSADELRATFTEFNIKQSKVKVPERVERKRQKPGRRPADLAQNRNPTPPQQKVALAPAEPPHEKKKNPLLSLV